MNITSRQLKAFLLTARHQSFSRAAERLFITQSGMSVLVRELEDQLGFRLFDRTTRRVTLTEHGTKFLPIADRSLLDLESAAANIGRSATAADRRCPSSPASCCRRRSASTRSATPSCTSACTTATAPG
jgi:DNA-binding transcriptional LysR family regulator